MNRRNFLRSTAASVGLGTLLAPVLPARHEPTTDALPPVRSASEDRRKFEEMVSERLTRYYPGITIWWDDAPMVDDYGRQIEGSTARRIQVKWRGVRTGGGFLYPEMYPENADLATARVCGALEAQLPIDVTRRA